MFLSVIVHYYCKLHYFQITCLPCIVLTFSECCYWQELVAIRLLLWYCVIFADHIVRYCVVRWFAGDSASM